MPAPRPTTPTARGRAPSALNRCPSGSVAVVIGERLAPSRRIDALRAVHRRAMDQHVVAGGIALDRVDAEEAALARDHGMPVGGQQRRRQRRRDAQAEAERALGRRSARALGTHTSSMPIVPKSGRPRSSPPPRRDQGDRDRQQEIQDPTALLRCAPGGAARRTNAIGYSNTPSNRSGASRAVNAPPSAPPSASQK